MMSQQRTALRSCDLKLDKISETVEGVRAIIENTGIEIHTTAFGRMKPEPEEETSPLHRAGETLMHVLDELKEVKSYLAESLEA